jgi:hypothetical protein
MTIEQATRPTRHRHWRTATALTLLAALIALATASSALAAPKGIFAPFAQCPTTEPGVTLCTYGETTGGEFAIGSTKVPINKTIIQQGGGIEIAQNEYALVPAKNGESLSKVELNVPGGLLDIVNCQEITGNGFFEKIERGSCEAIFENKSSTGVTATTELVANEHNPALLNTINLIFHEKTALVLPIRVHLKNPLLGEGCYIGSETHPIELHLTTGTTSPPEPNKPITGKVGKLEEKEENENPVDIFNENSLVDNAFSVPTAEGCGGFFSFLIDPIVDSKLGLESKAGHNTAILNGKLEVASASSVLASEK